MLEMYEFRCVLFAVADEDFYYISACRQVTYRERWIEISIVLIQLYRPYKLSSDIIYADPDGAVVIAGDGHMELFVVLCECGIQNELWNCMT